MPRAKEEPRGRLAALQDMLSGGSQVIFDQAQTIRDELQRRIVDVSRGLEGQVGTIVGSFEERLMSQLDEIVSAVASSFRRDLDRLRDRIRAVETRLNDVPKEGVRELVNPLQALANTALQSAAGAQQRLEELISRVQHVERQASEISRDAGADTQEADDVRQRLDRIESRLSEIARDTGGKLGEVGALRERLTRIEARVLETSRDHIARAGEATGLRDRLARLEARLSDISREQVARAVEAAGLRERVFRLEQRGMVVEAPVRAPMVEEHSE
jgi:methyl-accepting chemotaxis protein